MHRYRCVTFNHYPFCRGKVLFHLEGRSVRRKANCGGNCSSCSGCAA